MKRKDTIPLAATHPGELIKDELRGRGMTQKQLAESTGLAESVLSETINGKRNISLNTAVALEKALGIPADYWMNLQTQYELDSSAIVERTGRKEKATLIIPAHDHRLLQEISRKFGWACMF